MASNTKEPYVLIGLYQKLYFEKYGKQLTINKFREKWAMQDVIDSVGYEKAIELISYYFNNINKVGHPIQFFFFNFDKIEALKIEVEKDKVYRLHTLEDTKKMVEEGGM